ncbi:MAG: ABC transporter substrate-binding protein [Bacilli bacterium]
MKASHRKVIGLLSIVSVLSIVGLSARIWGASAATSADAASPATITFLHWRGEDVPVFNKIIAQFEQKYPNIKVQMQVIPSNQYIAQAEAELIGTKGADVFASFPGAEFSAISKAGLYTNLSSLPFVKNFNPKLIQAGKWQGKQLAIPYQVVFNMPVYNVGLFKQLHLSVPRDWPQFLHVCQVLKAHGDTPIIFAGQVSAGQFYNDMVMNDVTDPAVFSGLDTGKSKLTDPAFLKSFQQLSVLAKDGYFQKGALGTSQDAATAIFSEGKSGMLALGSYQEATVKADNPAIQMGLLAPITTPTPKASYVGIDTTTFMLGVNAHSQHKAAAEDFISFLSQPNIASEYANGTDQMVSVKGVRYTSPSLRQMAPLLTKSLRFQPMYTLTNQQVVTAVTNTVENVLGGMNPLAAAKRGQKEISQAISLK